MPKGYPGTEHGTASMYSNHGCRCEPCRAAHAAYYRGYTRKGKRIGVSFWGEEAQLIRGAARARGLSPTEWMRSVVAEALAEVDSEATS